MNDSLTKNSVGIVKPEKLHFNNSLELKSGRVLPAFDLIFEPYGDLNASRSTAILVCTLSVGTIMRPDFTPPKTKKLDGGMPASDPGKR